MFTRKNIFSISCSDLADSINNTLGIKRNDYDNPDYISSSDILNAFSCKQECDSKYFVEISISKNKINDVIEEYHNAIFITSTNEIKSNYAGKSTAKILKRVLFHK